MTDFPHLHAVLLLSLLSTPALGQTVPPGPAGQMLAPGCGDSHQKWAVSTDRSKHPLAAPLAGRALVYFLQDDTNFSLTPRPTTRFGLNGKWVGATQANAYFYVAVDPGEQHVCASWQGWAPVGHTAGADHFTAEAGKSYFFVVRDQYINIDHGPANMKLEPINGDEGQLLMSKFGFSTSHAKK